MKHNDFIDVYPNVLDKYTCDRIIQYFEDNYRHPDDPDCKIRAGYGSNDADMLHLNRHDCQWYMDLDDPCSKLIRQVVDYCWDQYTEKYWVMLPILVHFEDVKLQKTPPRGGFHTWHCETNDLSVVDRCAVWTLYLNDIPEGEGETEFLWQGRRIQPKAGTMAIWPAFFTHHHRGNPVYSCNKYIATGWALYTPDGDDKRLPNFYWDDENKNYIGKRT